MGNTFENRVPNHVRLIQIAAAIWPARSIYLAAKMGLADLLASESRSAASLSESVSVPVEQLARLLHALTSIGVLTVDPQRRFTLTPVGAALRTGAPGSARAVILLMSRDRLLARNVVESCRKGEALGSGSLACHPNAPQAPKKLFVEKVVGTLKDAGVRFE